MKKEKLIKEILKYFNSDIIYDECIKSEFIITKNNKIRVKDINEQPIDLFIYLYNEKQKYEHKKATFNHNTQMERFEVLDNYYNDLNFSRFRICMNKLLKNSYYLGHPLTFQGDLK